MAELSKRRLEDGDVDSYITSAPVPAQPMLRQLRQMIKGEAAGASERLSYGMPYYELDGRLVYFAAHKAHVGVYGLAGGAEAPPGLNGYLAARGTLQFPFGQLLPIDELQSALRVLVEQNQAPARTAGDRERPKTKGEEG